MLIEMTTMPKELEYLRTRLRIEQSRCLLWGEKVGLVEELLEAPEKLLQLNHNLVLDVLHDMQTAFRASMATTSRFDQVVAAKSRGIASDRTEFQSQAKPSFLQKTLAVWERGGRAAARVDFAMLKKNSLEKLVTRLVQYNNQIESFLDRKALGDLHVMQAQHNLTLLQIADKVDRIQDFIEAMNMARSDFLGNSDHASTFSRTITLNESADDIHESVISLAEFKMHHMRIEMDPSSCHALSIKPRDLLLDGMPQYVGRQSGRLHGRKVLVEWRESIEDALSHPAYRSTVEERVMKLAAILAARDKPGAFHSPHCVGYYYHELHQDDDKSGYAGYALVYAWPPNANGQDVELVSFREVIRGIQAPSTLNARLKIARMLAGSLLYIHAVGWVHKDVRSDNILFAADADGNVNMNEPVLSGFEFSRPALPEEVTTSHQFSKRHDLYRHPDLLRLDNTRSKKSHDIYSLGLVLAEIALWRPIEDIAEVKLRRAELKLVRERMLKSDVSIAIAGRAGWTYADLVQDCIEGGQALDISPGENEEDPDVGVRLSNALHQRVVQKLESIKI